MRHLCLYLYTFKVFSNVSMFFWRILNQKILKEEKHPPKWSTGNHLRSYVPAAVTPQVGRQLRQAHDSCAKKELHQTCFSRGKLEKGGFCPHIFVWRGPFFFVEWLLIFFQKTQLTKIRRALFRFLGFSWPRRGGHFIVVCPTFATTNGSSKFSASWDETKKALHVRHGTVLRQLCFCLKEGVILGVFLNVFWWWEGDEGRNFLELLGCFKNPSRKKSVGGDDWMIVSFGTSLWTFYLRSGKSSILDVLPIKHKGFPR